MFISRIFHRYKVYIRYHPTVCQFEKLKGSTKQLVAVGKKWDMKIDGAKCKIISRSDQAVVLDGSEVEHVKEFVFLGSVVPNSNDNVRRRISLALAAFGRLNIPIWQKREISKPLKVVRLYKALILPIATQRTTPRHGP